MVVTNGGREDGCHWHSVGERPGRLLNRLRSMGQPPSVLQPRITQPQVPFFKLTRSAFYKDRSDPAVDNGLKGRQTTGRETIWEATM